MIRCRPLFACGAPESGFTLLEVIIALSIMVISFASILSVESNAINASDRAKRMNIVQMLAKGKLIETETLIEGKPFEQVKKDDEGTFKDPYQDFRWATKVAEIDFPNISNSIAAASGGGGGGTWAAAEGAEGSRTRRATPTSPIW